MKKPESLLEKPKTELALHSTNLVTRGLDLAVQLSLSTVSGLRKAAEQGFVLAQYNLGVMYEDGINVTQDYEEAHRWYRKAAEQEYAEAEFNLGVMYAKGRGVAQDYAEAVKWYRKAAEQGIAIAQYNLGVMYTNGQGVTQDHDEAMKWYLKAAEQGLVESRTFVRQLEKI